MLQSVDEPSPEGLLRIIAHEMAHLWFGNLVTPQTWSQLYLKEGFATHLGFLAEDVAMINAGMEKENELA